MNSLKVETCMSCSFFCVLGVKHGASMYKIFLDRWMEGKEGGINELVYVKAFCKLKVLCTH